MRAIWAPLCGNFERGLKRWSGWSYDSIFDEFFKTLKLCLYLTSLSFGIMLSTPSPSETYCDALRSSFELLAHFLIHSKTHKKVKKAKN